jgi:hypothetical protein
MREKTTQEIFYTYTLKNMNERGPSSFDEEGILPDETKKGLIEKAMDIYFHKSEGSVKIECKLIYTPRKK